MVNWTSVLILCSISVGGWMAAVYEVIAINKMLPVGHLFIRNGIMTISGGIIALSSIIVSILINPWWIIFIILVLSWFLSQTLVNIFKVYSQLVSIILMVTGIILLVFKVLI